MRKKCQRNKTLFSLFFYYFPYYYFMDYYFILDVRSHTKDVKCVLFFNKF